MRPEESFLILTLAISEPADLHQSQRDETPSNYHGANVLSTTGSALCQCHRLLPIPEKTNGAVRGTTDHL